MPPVHSLGKRRWTLYDFDAHWPAFWEVWTMDEVQYALEDDMLDWCFERAPYTADGVRPTWHPGDPLWHLSCTNHWDAIITDRVDAKMDVLFPDPYRAYKRTMEAQFLPVVSEETFHDTIFFEEWHSTYDKVYKECQPRHGTLESLVLVMGSNYLVFALAVTACLLFPDKRVFIVRNGTGNDFVVLPDDGIVFDLIGYYNKTRLGKRRKYGAMIFDDIYEMLRPDSM